MIFLPVHKKQAPELVINLERIFINSCKIGQFLKVPRPASVSSNESTEFRETAASGKLNLMMDDNIRSNRLKSNARPLSSPKLRSYETNEVRIEDFRNQSWTLKQTKGEKAKKAVVVD
jgi:hypothetical protein